MDTKAKAILAVTGIAAAGALYLVTRPQPVTQEQVQEQEFPVVYPYGAYFPGDIVIQSDLRWRGRIDRVYVQLNVRAWWGGWSRLWSRYITPGTRYMQTFREGFNYYFYTKFRAYGRWTQIPNKYFTARYHNAGSWHFSWYRRPVWYGHASHY